MMGTLRQLYHHSLALLTDLYQITMAYAYWRSGKADREAVFQLFFRENPFGGGFTLACGLAYLVEFLEGLRFDREDLSYLGSLQGNDGAPLFEPAFLEELASLRLACDVDAVQEGTVVFPREPLVRVRGPILQCQILETPILNLINFQSLIATKAARICLAAAGDPVVEFGLRRAQGVDGSLAASRAAYVGGCAGTSNVLAGKLFEIPVKGTHAHSWVMAFPSELEAFEEYARAMPNNCIFLVDTYDSLEGVRRAIQVAKRLRRQGHELAGVRLDSGDLAYLSIEARRLLDEAGFPRAAIVASNDLDEHLIESLKLQGARISVWGVGTRLATAYDQPALGGVYKLSALRDDDGRWEYKVKLSEQIAKISIPGLLQVRRFGDAEGFVCDVIYDELLGIRHDGELVDPMDMTRRRGIPRGEAGEDLLVPVIRHGQTVYEVPSLEETRRRTGEQLSRLHPGIRRFLNPHQYPAGLEQGLFELRQRLILEARRIHT